MDPAIIETLRKIITLPVHSSRKKSESCVEACSTLYSVTYSRQPACPVLMKIEDKKKLEAICDHLFCPDEPILDDWLKNVKVENCSLELFNILHEKGIVQFTSILFYHSNAIEHFGQALVETAFAPFKERNDFENIKNVFLSILSSVINVGSFSLRTLFSHAASLLEYFSSKIVEGVNDGRLLNIAILSQLVSRESIIKSQLKLFAVSLLSCIVTYPASSATLTSALAVHYKEWIYNLLSVSSKNLLSEVSSFLSPEEILKEVDAVSCEHSINFKFLCALISVYYEQQPDSLDIFKAQGETWFKMGLNSKDEAKMGLGLLTVRHACGVAGSNFSNYANWFGTLSIKSPPAYSSLFKFLSQLVPYESPLFLKIHVTRVPPAPSSGQKSSGDYLSLAKTRLSDLNEPSEFMGLFNDFHESFQEQLKADLNRLMKQFEEKKEIPGALREAFMLRKQYYDKIFLPYLLSVPETEDPLRADLIRKLQAAGKVPSSLYRNWKKS